MAHTQSDIVHDGYAFGKALYYRLRCESDPRLALEKNRSRPIAQPLQFCWQCATFDFSHGW